LKFSFSFLLVCRFPQATLTLAELCFSPELAVDASLLQKPLTSVEISSYNNISELEIKDKKMKREVENSKTYLSQLRTLVSVIN
jgi:hypothetical protein